MASLNGCGRWWRVDDGASLGSMSDERPLEPELQGERPGSQSRHLGADAGFLEVPDDFDRPLPDDELQRFEGEAPEAEGRLE